MKFHLYGLSIPKMLEGFSAFFISVFFLISLYITADGA